MNEAKITTEIINVDRLTIISPAARTASAFCMPKARASCNFCGIR